MESLRTHSNGSQAVDIDSEKHTLLTSCAIIKAKPREKLNTIRIGIFVGEELKLHSRGTEIH